MSIAAKIIVLSFFVLTNLFGQKQNNNSYVVNGRVLFEKNKKPISDVRVIAFSVTEATTDKKRYACNSSTCLSTTKKDGEFRFSLNNGEKYAIVCIKEGFISTPEYKIFEEESVLPGEKVSVEVLMSPFDGIFLKGKVLDKKTKLTIPGSEVIVESKDEVFTVLTDQNGFFELPLSIENEYYLSSQKDDFLPSPKRTLSTYDIEKKVFEVELEMKRIDLNSVIVVQEELFKVNQDKLIDNSSKHFEPIINILLAKPDIKVEIRCHTDSRGDDAYNFDLSNRRSKAIKSAFIEAGVKEKQITAKGFGERKLINECSNGIKCSNAKHLENRRVEFVWNN